MTKTVSDEYTLKKECKHSWCMEPVTKHGQLAGMSVYLPKSACPDQPTTIKVTVEIPE